MAFAILLNLVLASSVSIMVMGASVVPRQATLPSGWGVVGCYTDSTTSRTLKTAAFTDVTGMTIEECLAFCSDYLFAGLEFSRECYCDDTIESTGTPATSGCDMACTGNAAEICGGSNRISIFENTGPLTTPTPTSAPPAPTAFIKQTVGTYQYKGCFQDGVNNLPRSLLHQLSVPGGVSAESCTAACQTAGYALAGLEFAQECWCDTYMAIVGVTPDSDCNMPCQADATELCGAGNRLAVYQDTSATPPDPTACLTNQQFVSTTQQFQFDLQAVPNPGGGTGWQLGALELPAFENDPSWYYLTTQNVENESHTFNFLNSIFQVDNFDGLGDAIPLPPNVGDVQVFATVVQGEFGPYAGYCVKPNPVGLYGPFIGPPTMAVNGRNDLWAICQNLTEFAVGQLDLVYSPQATNTDYDLADCQDVVLEMTPPTNFCRNQC